MRRKFQLLLFVCTFFLISCAEEEAVVPQEVYDLNVILPSGMSWQNRDVISAGVNNMSSPLSGVSGDSRAADFTFKKPLSDGAVVRFPAVANPATLAIPSEQHSYCGGYDPAAVHLYGRVELKGGQVSSVELKNLMAVLKLSVKGDASLIHATLRAVAGEPVNGMFNLTQDGSVSHVKSTADSTTVVFNAPLELDQDNSSDLYLPIPAMSYSKGLRLTLHDNEFRHMVVDLNLGDRQLASDSVTEFNLAYAGGYMTSLKPGDDFGAGSLTELEEVPLYGKYSAQGKVVYDDGQPAVGVKVSDGFTLVQTDENGMYAFKTAGKDVRYIYISYPADARVTVSESGCPEFFQKYEEGRYVYDFNLIRQPVEKEFAVFAMADPQTHYQPRGTQKIADTERYGSETVPALNAEIAGQTLPCYGISLGDITYSEDNRDSTPSMEIIRGHFSRVNMPIFNVMGNHDYTYYKPDASVAASEGSSTVNLLSQRSYEEVFGPVNFSFDRGNVHFVCMKDVYFNSTATWNAGDYSGGFTDAEYQWLVQDLGRTLKSMKVVLCVHIPLSTSNGPNMSKVKDLLDTFADAIVFSGHTHYQRTVYDGERLYEQIHAAVCGQWWWSRIEGDGCPNGYTVHYFKDRDIEDAYFIGVNEGMNAREYQMRIYKGNLRTGGKYAFFQQSHEDEDYLINVFNGDEKWKVRVYEDGVYMGQADLIPQHRHTLVSGTEGKVHSIPTLSSQDWWAIGYHIGCCKRGSSGSSYQTANYHMWKWSSKNPSAEIRVEAEDPYGNIYTCEDVVTDGMNYPDYIRTPLSL